MRIVCYSAIDLVGTKDLKKGLAGRASKSKSKSLEPKSKSKSKSSKNGLKSGFESKSGLEYYKSAIRPVERRGRGSLSHALRRLGAPPSLKNIKYTRMRQNSQIFSPDGPRENVSPGPAVVLDIFAVN